MPMCPKDGKNLDKVEISAYTLWFLQAFKFSKGEANIKSK